MKRFISILLCVSIVLCMALMAGCSGEETENTESENTEVSGEVASQSEGTVSGTTTSETTSNATTSSSSKTTSSSKGGSGSKPNIAPTPFSSQTNAPSKFPEFPLGVAKNIPSNATKPVKNADSTYIPAAQGRPDYSGHNSPDSAANIDDNIFIDAMEYSGYNLAKHKKDGRMWQYVLSKEKKAAGWLSNITYGGVSSGYETTPEGAPDIQYFEKHGLVCASYIAYVYFNYLPNVLGIDTSMLDFPNQSILAHDWYCACLEWEKKGYTHQINYTTSGHAGTYLKLTSHDEIPIGSLVCMSPKEGSTHCSHICIYAGYKNGYHWVTHVGNENGPEFCSIERMTYGPDPQYMLAIFSTPTCVKQIKY
ncbi:MAG: hypothetical protein KBS52_05295 [Clostridiales bacterium]|nr:hypothetical protein [Candidatus Equinaster intestinalis]